MKFLLKKLLTSLISDLPLTVSCIEMYRIANLLYRTAHFHILTDNPPYLTDTVVFLTDTVVFLTDTVDYLTDKVDFLTVNPHYLTDTVDFQIDYRQSEGPERLDRLDRQGPGVDRLDPH